MSELTIAQVMIKYPDVKSFVDKNGTPWTRGKSLGREFIVNDRGDMFGDNQWSFVSMPGLRPRPQKKTIRKDGYLSKFGVANSKDFVFTEDVHFSNREDFIPVTVTYEIEE